MKVKKWKKYPIVYDAHTLLGSELHYYNLGLPYKLKKGLGYFFDSQLPRRADYIISVTKEIKDKLLEFGKVNPDSISVILNGVEIQHFRNIKEINPSQDGVKKLIYAGNLGEFQGIDHLLRISEKVFRLRKSKRKLEKFLSDFHQRHQSTTLLINPFPLHIAPLQP